MKPLFYGSQFLKAFKGKRPAPGAPRVRIDVPAHNRKNAERRAAAEADAVRFIAEVKARKVAKP